MPDGRDITVSPCPSNAVDLLLSNFGEPVTIVGVRIGVMHGIVETAEIERARGHSPTPVQRKVLKLKRGALAGVARVQGLTVVCPDTGAIYTIDQPTAQGPSLFDWFLLQPEQ